MSNIFLYSLEYFGIFKSKIRVPQGSKIQKSWKCWVLIPHIIKSRFYYTRIDQNNSPELLNLLFKHIFPIGDDGQADIFPIGNQLVN